MGSSESIRTFTENGLADWIPLDSITYNVIVKLTKPEEDREENDGRSSKKLRSFNEEMDESLLSTIFEELANKEEEAALERLFPGKTISVYREVNAIKDVKMDVHFVEIQHEFDYEFGKLFIEALNAIVEDKRIYKNNDVYFFTTVFVQFFFFTYSKFHPSNKLYHYRYTIMIIIS